MVGAGLARAAIRCVATCRGQCGWGPPPRPPPRPPRGPPPRGPPRPPRSTAAIGAPSPRGGGGGAATAWCTTGTATAGVTRMRWRVKAHAPEHHFFMSLTEVVSKSSPVPPNAEYHPSKENAASRAPCPPSMILVHSQSAHTTCRNSLAIVIVTSIPPTTPRELWMKYEHHPLAVLSADHSWYTVWNDGCPGVSATVLRTCASPLALCRCSHAYVKPPATAVPGTPISRTLRLSWRDASRVCSVSTTYWTGGGGSCEYCCGPYG